MHGGDNESFVVAGECLLEAQSRSAGSVGSSVVPRSLVGVLTSDVGHNSVGHKPVSHISLDRKPIQ